MRKFSNIISYISLQRTVNLRSWEKDIELPFDPFRQSVRSKVWVNLEGNNFNNTQFDHITAEQSLNREMNDPMPCPLQIPFIDAKHFVAGQLHQHLEQWNRILNKDSPLYPQIIDWLTNGVNIASYFTRFKGHFWGIDYNHEFPPQRFFNNANNCKGFIQFINETILERLQNGSVECLGKVGSVAPPHIVSPLTVEPTKPRLCLNLMYLNNWILDIPFTLDTLKDVPRIVKENAYFTSLDDKSSFDHIFLTPRSQDFVCFQWAGYFFRMKVLPFGFKLSSYIYHTINLQPTTYIRQKFGIPMFLYIDDRLIEEIRNKNVTEGYMSAQLANYIVCEVLTRLGYCINLEKSVLQPTQFIVFLGFSVDSINRCFRLTNEKKQKFIELRSKILAQSYVAILDLQKLAGRCISFILAVPAAKLYTREMNAAIALGVRTSSLFVKISESLREEIMAWQFLDHWKGKLQWKSEKHVSVTIYTDASTFKWGGVFSVKDKTIRLSDFWSDNERKKPIMVLEARALLNMLRAIKANIKGHRVVAFVDNKVLISAWNNEGCRSSPMNQVLKEIFHFVLENDILLNLAYVQSKENLADNPSRELKKSDACLTSSTWAIIQERFGQEQGHTLDLMALDSNCMIGRDGRKLRHFTPYKTPVSSGVDMFAQNITESENCYVFPPFNLILPVIKFVMENNFQCTEVVPSLPALPLWLLAIGDRLHDALLSWTKKTKRGFKISFQKGFCRGQIWSTV